MSVAQAKANFRAKRAKKATPKTNCGNLKAQRDALDAKIAATEKRNAERKKKDEERIAKRQKKESEQLAAKHQREQADLDVKWGCTPPKKGAKRKPRAKKEAKAGAPTTSPAAAETGRAKAGKKVSKAGKRASKAAAKAAANDGERSPQPVPTELRREPEASALAPMTPTQRAAAEFRNSEQTVADILRRAYPRTWVFPWEELPDDAPALVRRDREAWTKLLGSGIDSFNDEARFSGPRTELAYLASDDDTRAQYPGVFLRPAYDRTLGPLVVLAAREVGFGVDGGVLDAAHALGIKPDKFIINNLVQLRQLVGTGPGLFIKEQVERVAHPVRRTQERRAAAVPAAEARPSSPTSADLFTTADLENVVRKIHAGTITLDEYQGAYRRLLASREGLMGLWRSQTKQQLSPKAAPADLARHTKEQLVALKWNGWVRAFILTDTPGTYLITLPGKSRDTAENVRALVEAVTPEALARYNAAMQRHREVRLAEVTDKRARMADPQTLDDYNLIVAHRGEAALTAEQRVRYDELRAEATMARVEERHGPRSIAVPAVGKSWQIVDTWHFRRMVPTWTVQKDTKGRDIPADEFKALASAARALGGGWERFAKTDGARKAVPGFLFYSREAAEKFVAALAGQVVSNADEVAAREARQTAAQAEHLRELADRTSAAATDELGRDRLTNTYRRSEQTHAIQQRARADLGLAESLAKIAEAIGNRSARFLGHVQHRSQVETLDRLLRQAQYRRKTGADALGPPTLADIDAVEYPYPVFYGSILRGIAQDAEKVAGFKLAAKAVQKLVRGKDSALITFSREAEIELLRKLARGPGGKRLAGELEDYDRVQAMRLLDLSTLRAALREYLGCCKGTVERESPIAAAERGLVGRQFPGYFPTPRELAAEVVELADIRAGNRVLEPSAGKGDLAAAVRAAAPAAELVTVELQHDLAELLRAKGFEVAARDFLEETPATLGTFDRIVANPPFEDSADIDHVRHMWSFLRPGGRLVSIMSEGPFFRQDRKAQEFRAWLATHGGTSTKNPDGSFRSSDRPTGVATRIVVVERGR